MVGTVEYVNSISNVRAQEPAYSPRPSMSVDTPFIDLNNKELNTENTECQKPIDMCLHDR